MKPIILTDVDGVLIQWQSGLPFFAQKYGIESKGIQQLQYTEKFIPYDEIFSGFSEREAKELFNLYNSSEYIRYLAAYRDAIESVNRLKEDYDFISVSALSSNMDTILKRRFNLNAHFPGAFIDFVQCDADTPKTEVFQKSFTSIVNVILLPLLTIFRTTSRILSPSLSTMKLSRSS